MSFDGDQLGVQLPYHPLGCGGAAGQGRYVALRQMHAFGGLLLGPLQGLPREAGPLPLHVDGLIHGGRLDTQGGGIMMGCSTFAYQSSKLSNSPNMLK